MQRCILQYFRRPPKEEGAHDSGGVATATPPQFVDMFCGIGGASQGAFDAGYRVVLAVDSCAKALKVHKTNHPHTAHVCARLPGAMELPLPTAGVWHLHGSPPCTKISLMNQQRDGDMRREGLDLIRWYLEFAMNSSATSWSMEQVDAPWVQDVLRAYLKRGSPYRTRLDWTVINFKYIGVPQSRKRLIAGPPALIAKLRRLKRVRKSVRQTIPVCRGTATRNELYYRSVLKKRPGGTVERVRIAYGHDQSCWPLDGPSQTVTASNGVRWANPGTGTKSFHMHPKELALLQTFPANYRLPKGINQAVRGVGNALPPLAMQKILIGDAPPAPKQGPHTPSLLWRPSAA